MTLVTSDHRREPHSTAYFNDQPDFWLHECCWRPADVIDVERR